MEILIVYCPKCDAEVPVVLERHELREGATLDGVDVSCECGCCFEIEVYPQIRKRKVQ